MLIKIIVSNIVIALFTVIVSVLSYADSFTINVPNAQGGYTPIVIQQSGSGYTGPQGEYYSEFPSVAQLQAVYGLNGPNPTAVDDSSAPQDEIVTVPPPALPVYEQPDPPGPNYLWVPGYWSYDSFFQDYYWVPGTWATAPAPGLLWTPGYWYWEDGHFGFNNGYWADHVGFYGGINYGHGYEGRGFSGGAWNNNVFIANRADNVTNVTNTTNNYSSFNGGPGGTSAKPTFEEESVMKERHIPPTAVQEIQVQAAQKNPDLRASLNHGKPSIAATIKPGVFKGAGVVAARQAGAFYDKTKFITPSPGKIPQVVPHQENGVHPSLEQHAQGIQQQGQHSGTDQHAQAVQQHPAAIQLPHTPQGNVKKPAAKKSAKKPAKKPVEKKPQPATPPATPPANGDNPQDKKPPASS